MVCGGSAHFRKPPCLQKWLPTLDASSVSLVQLFTILITSLMEWSWDRPEARSVSALPLTSNRRFWSNASACGICVGQSGTGTGFSPSIWSFILSLSSHRLYVLFIYLFLRVSGVSTCHCHPTVYTYYLFIYLFISPSIWSFNLSLSSHRLYVLFIYLFIYLFILPAV